MTTNAYQLSYDGIYYQSQHGTELHNWALFEPFDLDLKRPVTDSGGGQELQTSLATAKPLVRFDSLSRFWHSVATRRPTGIAVSEEFLPANDVRYPDAGALAVFPRKKRLMPTFTVERKSAQEALCSSTFVKLWINQHGTER